MHSWIYDKKKAELVLLWLRKKALSKRAEARVPSSELRDDHDQFSPETTVTNIRVLFTYIADLIQLQNEKKIRDVSMTDEIYIGMS